MRGSNRFLPWVAVGALVCVVLCLRGLVPPELAIKGGGRAEPIAVDLRHDAAGPTDSVPSASAPSPEPAVVPETAVAAVRLVLSGLRENRLEVLWDALPASYQRDVNDLVHLFANRLHPEAWRWLQQIAAKGAKALRLHAAAVLPNEQPPDSRDDAASGEAKASIKLAGVLDRFSQSGSRSLEMLKTADVTAVIRCIDRQSVSDLVDVVNAYSAGGLRELLEAASKARISTKDLPDEMAMIVVDSSKVSGADWEFLRIDGKWVPRQLADNWGATVAQVREALEQTMPSDTARDNFGATFQLLAGIDSMLEEEILMQKRSGDDSLDAEVESTPSMYQWMVLLGYFIGGPPSTDPDFHQKTKQTLADKTKVVLVYCYAGKELNWGNEAVDYDLARYVAHRLKKHEIKVIDSDLVYDWLEKNTKWTKTAEIGAAFKADYVVHIDLKDYSLFEAHSNNLYRGHADLIVNVVRMDEDKRDGNVIYSTAVKSFFPTRSPVDSNVMSYVEFKKHYLSALSDEIGRLFYAGNAWNELSETTDEEQAGARIGDGSGVLTGITHGFGEDGDEQLGSRQELTPQEREARATTNSDVVAMVQNGILDSVVCNAVRVWGGRFDLSPKGIEALKRAGVSDQVIDAMQDPVREKK